jgi:hypothetical protein
MAGRFTIYFNSEQTFAVGTLDQSETHAPTLSATAADKGGAPTVCDYNSNGKGGPPAGPPLCITQNSHRLSTLDRILVGYRQLSQSHVHAILVSKFKQSRRI